MDIIMYEQVPELFDSIGNMFEKKKEELCELDAKLGDGDLGLTMSKGFAALPGYMRDEMDPAVGDIGKMIAKAGMKMLSLIPSTMGFLMSSGVLEGGKAIQGKNEIDGIVLADYLVGFANGIQKRGKCNVGQRTIYDSIYPAGLAASKKIQEDRTLTLEEVISLAYDAALDGVEKTKDMAPVFGKAAVFSEQCKGVSDQGAIAGCYMIQAMKEYICA